MPVSYATHRRTLSVFLTFLCAFAAASCRAQEEKAVTLFPFDKPFLFAYGSWDKRAVIDGGKVILRGAGLTPQGGAGVNVSPPSDLTKYADYSPTLKVKVGAGNHLPKLRLLLADADGGVSFYDFALPDPLPSAGQSASQLSVEVWVTPVAGASLARPNDRDKKSKANLSRVMQWQLSGDWSSDKAVDVEVVSLSVTPATPDLLAQRTALDKAEADKKVAKDRATAERRAKYGKRTTNSPQITRVYAAAPDIVAIEIEAKRLVLGKSGKYVPQPGDTKREVKNGKGVVTQVMLSRGGEEIGWLIGPQRDNFVMYEQLIGDPLLDDAAESPANFTLFGPSLNARLNAIKPVAVYRKSKPTDWRMPMPYQQPDIAFAMRHTIYLKLPYPLAVGEKYTLDLGALNTQQTKYDFVFTPDTLWTEAIHVNQIGYRPDDTPKRAFLSVWLGTGGAVAFPDDMTFRVVDANGGKTAFTGRIERVFAAEGKDKLWKEGDYAKTNVYRMDFSPLTTPGTYRVVVEGVGCSYPVTIARDVWTEAFVIQMKGFLNERSGVALGPPYTPFLKPIDLHPAYGTKVVQSTYRNMDGEGEFALAKYATSAPVPEAWGGWHDAGDWNPRRVTHLKAAHQLMELCEMQPGFFDLVKWPLPDKSNAPSVLKECLFELDLFRRLQKPDGGVPFGIETAGDPIDGEVSWIQSMTEYVYASDAQASWFYAGAAARMAALIAATDPALSKTYRASAIRAFDWAERDRARLIKEGKMDKINWNAKDDRNYAALTLYAATGEKRYHDVFLEDTILKSDAPNLFQWGTANQRDAAFFYAKLPARLGDPQIKKNARAGVERQAQTALTYANGNAFNLTTSDPGQPMFLSYFSIPNSIELARAHFLTENPNIWRASCSPRNFPPAAIRAITRIRPESGRTRSGIRCTWIHVATDNPRR